MSADSAPPTTGEQFTPTPAPPAAVLAPLTESGVVVSSIDAPVAVAGGVNLTDWQAANLIRQAGAGSGWTGLMLRTELPLGDGVIPIDNIVAAWLLTTKTTAADSARKLMAAGDVDQMTSLDSSNLDSSSTVFPFAVLTLFVQDLAYGIDAAAPAGLRAAPAGLHIQPASLTRSKTRPDLRIDFCASLLNFYDSTIGALFDAIGGRDSVWAGLANVALGLVKLPFSVPGKGGASIFAALGLLVSIAGAVNPWTMTIETVPESIAYGVAPAPGNRGAFRAVVDPGPADEWPAGLKSCAALLGLSLPDITPIGSIAHFDPTFGSDATVVGQPDAVVTKIDDRFIADLEYDTSVESAEQATGPATTSLIGATLTLERPGAQTFKAMVEQILTRALGERPTLAALLTGLIAGPLDKLDQLNAPSPAGGFTTVTFHLPPPPPDVSASSTLPPVDPATAGPCVGRDLISQGTADMPAGILLRLEANHTLVFDFSRSAAFSSNMGGVEVSITLTGTITAKWQGTPESMTTSANRVTLGATGSVDGNVFQLPPEFFNSFAAESETLTCSPDGSIVVARTGQVYR